MFRYLLIFCTLAGGTLAQDTPATGPQALTAFEHARALVMGGQAPGEPAPAVWGAAVTLREGGQRTIADALGFDMPRPGLVEAVARGLPTTTDPQARLTVELAGRPEPIDGQRGLGEAALAIAPGLDAVAVRVADRVAVVFPDAALAEGLLPSDMVVAALREALDGRLPAGVADGPGAWARHADAALRRGDFDLFRASATVLAQPRATTAPRFVHRGGRVVTMAEWTPPAVVEWAAGMADNLRRRQHEGLEPYGLLGTPDARTGRAPTPLEEPFAQALAAHALLRYGASAWAPQESADRAAIAGLVLLRQLAFVTPVRLGAMAELGENAPFEAEPWADAASAAMALIAMEALDAGTVEEHPELAAMRDRGAAVVRSAVGLSITGTAVFDPDLPEASHALVARALRSLSVSGIASPQDAALAHAAALAIARGVPAEMLVSQMPWLLGAMLPGEPLPEADRFLQMRRIVLDHQLAGPEAEGDARDLAGGIVFTRGGPPLPTWQSARAAVALSALLRDERLTPKADRPAEFLHLLRTLRFLRQLTADENLDHLLADVNKSAGGVRAAPWDQRQPAVATALSLLAACDALDAAYGR